MDNKINMKIINTNDIINPEIYNKKGLISRLFNYKKKKNKKIKEQIDNTNFIKY